MTEHTDKLKEILSTSLQNRNTQYSPTIQEKCVADLVELVPHLPEQAEQIIRAATNISDELCHKGHYDNAFRTADHIFGKLHDLPNTGMLCAKATQTLINSAMDAGEYQTAFVEIRKFMTTGIEKQIPEMFDFGNNAMRTALDDCEQNPNYPKLKAARSTAHCLARDIYDYDYLATIAQIAKQQSHPSLAIECYTSMAEIGIKDNDPSGIHHARYASKKASQLFLAPTDTCNIYNDPDIDRSVLCISRICTTNEVQQVGDALQKKGYETLAHRIANSIIRRAVDHQSRSSARLLAYAENIVDLASAALPALQTEMSQQDLPPPESTKLCIEVAQTCGLVLQMRQKWPRLSFDAKGLDAAPYQAFDMLFDNRPDGKLDLSNVLIAAGAYPEEDSYVKRMKDLTTYLYMRTPHPIGSDPVADTASPAFQKLLIDYADRFYDEAATENALRDFNRATRPLIPEGYRSLGPGLRQRQERPLLKLAV